MQIHLDLAALKGDKDTLLRGQPFGAEAVGAPWFN